MAQLKPAQEKKKGLALNKKMAQERAMNNTYGGNVLFH